MRIAIIANSVDALTLDRAGGFVHLIETAKRWNGVDMVVLGPRSAEPTFRKHLPGIAYVPIADFGGGATVASMLFRAFAALPHIPALRKECDVALAMSHSIPDALPALAFGASRSAVQYWHFIGNPLRRPGSLLRNILAYGNELVGRLLAERCRGFIFGNSSIGRQLGKLNAPFTCVTTNGLPQNRPATPVDRDGAVYVGRLHPAKGVDDLIEAWALVHRACPGERLTIVGTASEQYRRHLESLIAEHSLHDVITIRENVDDPEKWRILATARLFVFPSHEEGWGIAVAEAMSMGLPCVTYDLPAFQEVFVCGRLCGPAGDVETFARNIVTLLTDRVAYATLQAQATELSRSFTWERAADVELSVLNHLCA